MNDPSNLTRFQMLELIRWFMHSLPADKRTELIRTYPQTYNRLVGSEVGRVINVATRTDVDPAEPA